MGAAGSDDKGQLAILVAVDMNDLADGLKDREGKKAFKSHS